MSSFALLIALHFCRARLQYSCYNLSFVYVRTLSVPCVCVRLSRFVRAINCTCMHGFQNNLAQLFSLTSRSAIRNICSGTLKVKVRLKVKQ